MNGIIHYILDLGAGIFLPAIMILLGLCIGMKFKRAFTSGLTLGIAFIGMGVILGFMFGVISPAAGKFVENTGFKLSTIDVGWSPLSAIAWAWPYALALFPLQIVVNILMLAFGFTNVLNVDLWNVWSKILTSVIVVSITGSLPAAFIIATIQIIVELKSGDLLQKPIERISKIPGITCTHPMMLQGILLAPVNRLLDFIPGLKGKRVDAASLKEKIGIFGENSVMGFIVGGSIATAAGYDVKGILTTAIQVATALTLFPMVAKLFMQALSPIADATSNFMKNKFKDREIYIGLDWPFLAGSAEVWVCAIILVPIELVLAMVLSKMGLNTVLPLGGIINICFAPVALIITGGDLIRMIILGTMVTPLYLGVATNFAPMVTELARQVGTIDIQAGQTIIWSTLEAPGFRWIMAHAANIINGDIKGIIVFAVYVVLALWYYKYMKKVNENINQVA
ncbi:PTS galactitol transporter subunit IIC [Clostridiaceae bacterium M8S5]|nr:PTS galactitol transporter subunit IIC [Clostridiaceae bacterium M8S5]